MKSGSSNKLRTENWQEHIHRRTNYPRTTFPWVFWKIIWDNEPILIPLLLLLLSHFSRVWLCATPRTAAHQASCPWDSPGKNTGVGCHFLLQCMKVESESEVAQSCPTLSDPMDYSLPGSSIHGVFRATVLEWGAIAFSAPLLYLATI